MRINLPSSKTFKGLGTSLFESKPVIYFVSDSLEKINIAKSDDGFEFEKSDASLSVLGLDKKAIILTNLTNIRVTPLFKTFLMFYEQKSGSSSVTQIASSSDQINWQTFKTLPDGFGPGLNVENFVFENQHAFYFGGTKLRLGLTADGSTWQFTDLDVAGGEKFEVDFTLKTSQGLIVLYHHYTFIYGEKRLEVKVVCFDKNNPAKVAWDTKSSLWQEPSLWEKREATCMGCVFFEGRLLSYWNIPEVGIYMITYPLFSETPPHEHNHFELQKHPQNPILSPNSSHPWENEATFNAAAFQDGGKVYLIYRAIGYGYVSVLGYAESTDGITFDKRLAEPIYTGNDEFDTKWPEATLETTRKFISGGSWGGCEDPRITKIADRLYMIYVAFNGFDPPRLALTSMLYEDFLNHRFLWEKPVLISLPTVVDKSGCILPEKIGGKYVIFHRVYPNILIDFVDNLNFDGSTWLKGEFKIGPRPTMWDSRKIGVGAPPIKTKDGWLLIYQGVTDNDDSKYKIGAMLLDLKDPTKVLYRSNHPLVEPTEHYENGLAKFGIVYPCGAVIKDDKLLVYYGGSDSVTCVATAVLEEFIRDLKEGSNIVLSQVKFND